MSKVKRLLCLVSAMNTGGAETFLMKIYRKLDQKKYQMDFCVNESEEGFYDDEIKRLGGRIYVIPCKSENIKVFKEKLSNIVQENHYEYVLRITSNAMGFYDLKVAKDAGAKKCIARSSNSSDGGGVKVWVSHRIGKILYKKNIDVCMAPSDLAAEYTFGKRFYRAGKVHILCNAIDLDFYKYKEEGRRTIRREFNIHEDALVVGHIGRFVEQKNHKMLLRIFKRIHMENPSAVLLLVGEGKLESKIKKMAYEMKISKALVFAGVRSDIPNLLSAMDVFVFPSLYEGMPNTVIEAQALGLPCVVADTITREANITGLVQYRSLNATIKEWAEVAVRAAKTPRTNTREKLIQAGYDIERVTREFEKIVFS